MSDQNFKIKNGLNIREYEIITTNADITVPTGQDFYRDSIDLDTIIKTRLSYVDNGGDGSFTYDQNTGVFTYTGPSSAEVRAHFSAGTGVHYDPNTGVIAIGQPVETTSNVEFVDMLLTGNGVINGDLTVLGNTTTLNTAELAVEDINITVNYGTGDTTSTADGAGLTVQDAVSVGVNATFTWDATNDRWVLSHNLVAPKIMGDVIASDGSSIVLDNGTDGTDSTYRGTILAADDGSIILNNGTDNTDATIRANVLADNNAVILDAGTTQADATVKAEVLADNGASILEPGTDGTDAMIRADVYAQDNTSQIMEIGTNGTDSWVRADVQADDGTVIVYNGVNGTDSWFRGDIQNHSGTFVLNIGSDAGGDEAVFTGNVIGDVTGNVSSTGTSSFEDVITNSLQVNTTSSLSGDVTIGGGNMTIAASGDIYTAGNLNIDGEINDVSNIYVTSSNPFIEFTDTDTTATHRLNADSATGEFLVDVDNTTQGTSSSFIVNTRGTERLRIDGALGNATFTNNLEVDGGIVSIVAADPEYVLYNTGTANVNNRITNNAGVLEVTTFNNADDTSHNLLSIDNTTGDVSFFTYSTNTADFVWDATNNKLGLGGAPSGDGKLQVDGGTLQAVGNATISLAELRADTYSLGGDTVKLYTDMIRNASGDTNETASLKTRRVNGSGDEESFITYDYNKLAFGYNGTEMVTLDTANVMTFNNGGIVISDQASPFITYVERDASVNNKQWYTYVDAERFTIQALTDLGAGGGDLWGFNRSAEQITNFTGYFGGTPTVILDNQTGKITSDSLDTNLINVDGDINFTSLVSNVDHKINIGGGTGHFSLEVDVNDESSGSAAIIFRTQNLSRAFISSTAVGFKDSTGTNNDFEWDSTTSTLNISTGDLNVVDGNVNISTGYLSGPATFTIDPAGIGDNTGTVVIAGNLQVDGTTTTVNSTVLDIADLNITLGAGSTNAAAANGAGITVDLGTDGTATWTYNSANDWFHYNKDIHLPDNISVIFGDSSDMSIIHNGTNSVITNATGELRLASDTVRLGSANESNTYMTGTNAGAVDLYHNNILKMSTVGNGISVVDAVTVGSTTPRVRMVESDTTDLNTELVHGGGVFAINTINDALDTPANRFKIDHATGDIGFLDSTSTNQDFFWDASASRLGLNTTAPAVTLHATVDNAGLGTIARFERTNGADTSYININGDADANTMEIRAVGTTTPDLLFFNGSSETARFDSAGNFLVTKTTADDTNTGFRVADTGYVSVVRNGLSHVMNRITTDGDIIDFRKDGTSIGSIGTSGGNAYFAGTGAGLKPRTSDVLPTDGAGSATNGVMDIGTSTQEFKDLYLSGQVNAATSVLSTSLSVGSGVSADATSVTIGDSTTTTEAATLATVTQTAIGTYALASFRTAKVIIQAYDTVSGEAQSDEALITHNGTTANITIYGTVNTAASLATYAVDVNAGNVRLLATSASANSTEYTVVETLIVV